MRLAKGKTVTPQTVARKRTAFVTGASQGLGAALALRLAQDGYDVAVSGTNAGNLSSTVAALKTAGARVVAVALDLRSQDSIEQAMAHVVGEFGALDVLVNNAGITIRSLAVDVTREEWQSVMDINLTGTFFMSQQMGRHLIAQRREGCIVNISSTHGLIGFAQRSTYGISKAGISHMTRMLAIEWADHRIRVNAVAPGTVATPSRVAFFTADSGGFKAMIDRVPLARLCEMDEVAAMVSYLAGPQAAYITGQTMVLDGGLTAY
jgi:NAD(P)-dependent dehydrogenase (short-subunit alcohol dehydrogenase family)